jgi:hypothetical protein
LIPISLAGLTQAGGAPAKAHIPAQQNTGRVGNMSRRVSDHAIQDRIEGAW